MNYHMNQEILKQLIALLQVGDIIHVRNSRGRLRKHRITNIENLYINFNFCERKYYVPKNKILLKGTLLYCSIESLNNYE